MIKEEIKLIHWNYFLALEKDLEEISRFVELTSDNNETYSIELLKLLFSASSEVDVVLKNLCELLAPNKRRNNIDDYREVIKELLPALIEEKVYIPKFGLIFQPLKNWEDEELNPFWWKSYNNVKHHRNESYNEANLKNALNALGALLILVTYFYQQKFSIDKENIVSLKDVSYKIQNQPNLIRLDEKNYYSNYVG